MSSDATNNDDDSNDDDDSRAAFWARHFLDESQEFQVEEEQATAVASSTESMQERRKQQADNDDKDKQEERRTRDSVRRTMRRSTSLGTCRGHNNRVPPRQVDTPILTRVTPARSSSARSTSRATSSANAQLPQKTAARPASNQHRAAAAQKMGVGIGVSASSDTAGSTTPTPRTRLRRRASLTPNPPSNHSRARRLHSSPVRPKPPLMEQQLLHGEKGASLGVRDSCSMHDPDSTPGAFSVAGLDASMPDDSGTTAVSMHECSYNSQHSSTNHHASTTSPRPSSPPLLTVPTAVVVDESNDMDDERNSLARKQLELKEQEERLAEQAAKLRAWEEQLEQRRLDMEAQQQSQAATIVHASQVISEPTQAPTPIPTTRTPRLIRNFLSLSSRDIANDSSSSNHNSISDLQSNVAASCSSDLDSTRIPIPATVSRAISLGSSTTRTEYQQADTMPAVTSLDMAIARAELGDGPLRFAPPAVYSLDQVLLTLSGTDRQAFRRLKERWENKQDKRLAKYGFKKGKTSMDLPLQWHLRYLWLCAKQRKDGSYYFSVERAWKSEKKLQRRFLTLNVFNLREQLQSKTLFPVPGLKTSGGHDMFYMRPSRYFPSKTAAKTIIDNLCYVMNTMLENNEFAQKEGIGFVACMDEWKMKNFDISYCFQFMMALQGFMVPVKTQLFLIVNPPSWFGGIWKIMKPMLAPSFRKRVKIVPENKIAKYLAPGYEQYLPDDMQTGLADTNAMVQDFIAFRQFVDKDASMDADEEDAQSLIPSEASPIPYNLDYESMGPWSCSSESHSSASRFSFSQSGRSSSSIDDDDDASIHVDMDDEEFEDCKEAATPERQSRLDASGANMMGE